MKIFLKVGTPVFLFLFMILLMISGLRREEHLEVEFNGNILCLSCIGIE
ncbi:MAG TPA: hypothetical protein PKU94_07525 [Candidatus Hydrothermia bacterium]|nr:hypothetical protein [Candidatus Hydrothermae bacterium]MDD3649760.1 hypothetical protein [Candidatus Hydrothermia bacterium]MDD5573068.1 hypothetical protein [Candidatus Hydrothermia bacterium]HOK23709.1 hypothetical protein [Candidatus Hydrothermia bacterium]HOL24418.1 hypothetical protein [Candidatus Hydrothermia bacterium]